MKSIDLTKILEKHTSGWLALSQDYKKVIGKGITIKKALEQAKSSGVDDPVIVRAAKSYGPMVP
jgi:hypothetical protein